MKLLSHSLVCFLSITGVIESNALKSHIFNIKLPKTHASAIWYDLKHVRPGALTRCQQERSTVGM